jgi:tellurite resistance protein
MTTRSFVGVSRELASEIGTMSEDEKQALADIMVFLALSDGRLAEAEVEELETALLASPAFAGQENSQRQEYFARALSRFHDSADTEDLTDLLPAATAHLVDEDMRQQTFALACAVACCDGQVHDREREVLADLAGKLRLANEDAGWLMQEVVARINARIAAGD